MDEEKLVAQLKSGDEQAFTLLYKQYWGKVYHFTRLYLSCEAEREEVVQEVFVKVWEIRHFIKEKENFKGFLFIITRNAIFNNFRKSFREDHYKLSVLNSCFDQYDIEEQLETDDLQTYINSLVGQLTPRQQEVFRLSRENHLTYKEIASQLEITEKTVERHINDALRFLRKNIPLIIWFLGA
ncbi:MAG: RNA polymerase sigma-70 factor [Bacteroides sp.]